MNELNEALNFYSKAISIDKSCWKVAMLKRAITYIELNIFHNAL